jgi:hypothetical protein
LARSCREKIESTAQGGAQGFKSQWPSRLFSTQAKRHWRSVLLLFTTVFQSLAASGWAANALEPVKAIAVDKISCSNSNFNWGSCVAKNADDKLYIVYFRGFAAGAQVLGDELQWSIKHPSGKTIAPIALGAPTDETPFFIIGNIPRGQWVSLGGSSGEPLLALVVVAPKDAKELLLNDPAGGSHKVAVSTDWSAPKESFSSSLLSAMFSFSDRSPKTSGQLGRRYFASGQIAGDALLLADGFTSYTSSSLRR